MLMGDDIKVVTYNAKLQYEKKWQPISCLDKFTDFCYLAVVGRRTANKFNCSNLLLYTAVRLVVPKIIRHGWPLVKIARDNIALRFLRSQIFRSSTKEWFLLLQNGLCCVLGANNYDLDPTLRFNGLLAGLWMHRR